MTIGEVDAAPKDPKCVRSNADRAPTGRTECDNVRIVKVHGWWCTTAVSSVAQDVTGVS
ncbi:hypothetical protein [Streptomyces sp. NPDC056723]|uniref:hypothetical protein n=1 Tax=Streptomyces sp. NPDC056723 TaxID=3345925 RepID=UPI0036CB60B4